MFGGASTAGINFLRGYFTTALRKTISYAIWLTRANEILFGCVLGHHTRIKKLPVQITNTDAQSLGRYTKTVEACPELSLRGTEVFYCTFYSYNWNVIYG